MTVVGVLLGMATAMDWESALARRMKRIRSSIGLAVVLAGAALAGYGIWAKLHGKYENNGPFIVLASGGLAVSVVGLLFTFARGKMFDSGEASPPTVREEEKKDA